MFQSGSEGRAAQQCAVLTRLISPVLMNVALHGLEQPAGARYFADDRKDAGNSVPGTPVVVRYADDLVALCVSAEQAQQVKERLASWLAPRGLAFNEDKTRVVSLDRGFDFLGFNVRRYRNGKLLIKPSKEAVRRIRKRLAAEVKALHGTNAEAVISRLNPIIRGWAAYYRSVVSKETFSSLDHYVWRLTYRWAKRAHPIKSKRWVIARYFGMFNPSRRDRWVFGDRDSGRHRAPRTNPPHSASCTPTARVGKPPAVQRRGQLLNLPASLRGLLEPCAWKAGTHGSEGATRQALAVSVLTALGERDVFRPGR
jgi:hypothetical protein